METQEAREGARKLNEAYLLSKEVCPAIAFALWLDREFGFGDAIGRLLAIANGTVGEHAKIREAKR